MPQHRCRATGALHYVCIDWRHIAELMAAAEPVYGDTINIAVWVKSNAGQGSFYRSQHEFVGVFRVGQAPHLNNIELGRHGRSRSNVWHYAGVNSFRAGRMEELRSHPSAKPVALVADAIKDCTRRGDIVLDTFCWLGHHDHGCRAGRTACPCAGNRASVCRRRHPPLAGLYPPGRRHAESGLSFDEIAAESSRSGKFASRTDEAKIMKRSSGRHRIRGQKRSNTRRVWTLIRPIRTTGSVRVGRRRNINSSRAKAAILKARAENQGQLHPTSRLCSNVRSVER